MNAVYTAVTNEVTAARTPIIKRETTRTVTPCPSAHHIETNATKTSTPAVQAVAPALPPVTQEDAQKEAAATADP